MSDLWWQSVSGRNLAQGDLLPNCLLPVFVAPTASQSSDDSQEVSVLTARLLGLWQATSNGGKNLVPKIWGGKFPYQVKVKLVIPKVTDVPKSVLKKLGIDAAIGRFDNCVDEDAAEDLVGSLLGAAS